MLLAGDIGGTKTNLALFDRNESSGYPLRSFASFSSRSASNLSMIISQYLEQVKKTEDLSTLQAACFAMAGPVKDGVCIATNLPWVVDSKQLAQDFKLPFVFLINDLEANAYAIDILPEDQFHFLRKGNPYLKGNQGVVSPGTGLGEAGLFWDGKRHLPFATEGGHADFAPRTPLETALCTYLVKRFGHASYERILSGPGMYNLFQFFVEHQKQKPPEWLLQEMAKKDPSATISENALQGKSSLCSEVLQLFVSILGAELGNCALKWMATGGIYLGGGIPPKILPFLEQAFFLKSFNDKGRMGTLLQDIPIRVILDDKASLKGAAHYCRLHLEIAFREIA